MALTACGMVSCPAAASWTLVCTAALNCTYHGGAPFGNGACACALRMASSWDACSTSLALTIKSKLDSLAGSGNVLTTSFEPCSPAQRAWFSVSANQLMNFTAPATFFAVFGIPMPSGLATLPPTPLPPGVGMYPVSFTTLDDDGTL